MAAEEVAEMEAEEVVSKRVHTMPAFNSCIKCVGSRGIIHDHTPD